MHFPHNLHAFSIYILMVGWYQWSHPHTPDEQDVMGCRSPARGFQLPDCSLNAYMAHCYSGRLIALFDRVWLRQLVPPNELGNRFRMFEDIPTFWDAWDLEATHLEKTWDAGIPSSGPPPSPFTVGTAAQKRDSGTSSGASVGSKAHRPGPIPGASISIIESGPLRASLRVEFRISERSRLVEVISLTSVSPR